MLMLALNKKIDQLAMAGCVGEDGAWSRLEKTVTVWV